jgi:hypothetical protein
MEYYYDSPDDLPVATLEQQGITQLNSNVENRIDQAATPSAVKAAYDLAVANGAIAASNHQLLLAADAALGDSQGSLSNHVYQVVEPRVDAASNSWFASSNPLFAATEGLSNELSSLQGSLTLLQADVGNLALSSLWTSNASAFASNLQPDVAWSSNAGAFGSNASQAALGAATFGSNASQAAAWTSNALVPLSAQASFASNSIPSIGWTSNVAVSASNQAYGVGGGVGGIPDAEAQKLWITPSNVVTSGTSGIRLGGFTFSNQVLATAGNGDAKIALAVATARRMIESEAKPNALYVHNRTRTFPQDFQPLEMTRVMDVGGWGMMPICTAFRVPRTGTYQLSPYIVANGSITMYVNGVLNATLVSCKTSLLAWNANDLLEFSAATTAFETVYVEIHVAMI